MTDPEEKGRRRGPVTHISDAEIVALRDLKMSQREIANHFTAQGRQIGQGGISYRLKQIEERERGKAGKVLPTGWNVRVEHGTGWVYHAALAYMKWRRGEGLKPADLSMARRLEAKLEAMDAVLTYDRDKGFQLRNRKPSDPGLLV